MGTAIGGAVGGLVGLGIGLGREICGEHADEKIEKSTQPVLQGALEQSGMTPVQAERASFGLRDVNGDFFGVGKSLHQIAQRTGENPQAVLQKVARDAKGAERLLIGEGYMPAQAFHLRGWIAPGEDGAIAVESWPKPFASTTRRRFEDGWR